MKKSILYAIVSASLLLLLHSCYYDNEQTLYPFGTNCDTTNVTYSTTVRNILQNGSCLTCHSGTAASGGAIALDNYVAVKTIAQSGRLYGAINHAPGYQAMPQNGGKLTVCDIRKVKVWIDAGMLNN